MTLQGVTCGSCHGHGLSWRQTSQQAVQVSALVRDICSARGLLWGHCALVQGDLGEDAANDHDLPVTLAFMRLADCAAGRFESVMRMQEWQFRDGIHHYRSICRSMKQHLESSFRP